MVEPLFRHMSLKNSKNLLVLREYDVDKAPSRENLNTDMKMPT